MGRTEAIHFLPASRMIDPQTHAEYQRLRKEHDLHQLIDL